MLCGEVKPVTSEHAMKDSRTQPVSSELTAFTGCQDRCYPDPKRLICVLFIKNMDSGAGNVAFFIQYLHSIHRALGSDINAE